MRLIQFGLAVFTSVLFIACEGIGQCFETMEDRPCLPDSITYEDGTCECMSKFGTVSWSVSGGCGWRD